MRRGASDFQREVDSPWTSIWRCNCFRIGPNISASEVVNIAPGEGQIPFSFTSEPDWEALSFPKDYYIGKKDDVKSGSGAIDHVAFNADDIEGMKSKLDKMSMEYTHRKVPGFPLEQLFIMDPDGVKVELNYATS